MRLKIGVLLLASSAMVAPAVAQQGQPNPNQVAAKALLQAADKAIGASSVKSYTTAATGWMGYPGQQYAQGDLPHSDLKSFNYTVDYGSKSAKWDYVRVQGNNGPRGGGAGFPVQGEQHFTEIVNGNMAWDVNAQGQPVRQAADAAGDRQVLAMSNPIGFVQAGLAAPNAAVTDRYFGRENRTVKVVAFTTKVCDGPQPQCTRRVTGEFNKDNMLERVVTWVPDPVLGDKMVEFRWSEYRDVGGGVKLPFHVHAHMGDHPLIPGGHNYLDLRISDIKVNVANSATAVPDAVRNAPLPTQNRVVSTQLAPGVVLVGGGSHNSVAVEFKDFVTVIEGPLSNQRTNAVVAEVHKLFPNKPIKYLVNTHNHFDHLGGVRGFVAAYDALTGKLTPQTTFPPGDFRGNYFAGDRVERTVKRVEKIRETIGTDEPDLATAALKFALKPAAVSTVIAGIRNQWQAEKNCAAGGLEAMSDELEMKLRGHYWRREFWYSGK